MSITKGIGVILTTTSLVLGLINCYLLYDLVGATTTMWVIFWVYIVLFIIGTLLTVVGDSE